MKRSIFDKKLAEGEIEVNARSEDDTEVVFNVVQCAGCSHTKNLKKFGEDFWCEDCVGSGIPVCSECGISGDESYTISHECVTFCQDCRSVDSFNILEWEDGK